MNDMMFILQSTFEAIRLIILMVINLVNGENGWIFTTLFSLLISVLCISFFNKRRIKVILKPRTYYFSGSGLFVMNLKFFE